MPCHIHIIFGCPLKKPHVYLITYQMTNKDFPIIVIYDKQLKLIHHFVVLDFTTHEKYLFCRMMLRITSYDDDDDDDNDEDGDDESAIERKRRRKKNKRNRTSPFLIRLLVRYFCTFFDGEWVAL